MALEGISTDYTAGASSYANTPQRIPLQTLGQQDFLKLLVTQFTMQDPMNPKQDTEFISQMASFSALEQSKAMQADMARLRAEQQVTQANSLLGRTVSVQLYDKTVTTGVVDAVGVQAGTPRVVVGGQLYDLSQIVNIAPTLNSQPEPQ